MLNKSTVGHSFVLYGVDAKQSYNWPILRNGKIPSLKFLDPDCDANQRQDQIFGTLVSIASSTSISPSPFILFKNTIIHAIEMTHEQDN